MFSKRVAATVSALLVQHGLAEMQLKIQGQSGKFTLYDDSADGGIANGIKVTMDAVREVDASGAEVGASGATKHSLNTFASQEFVIDPMKNVSVGNASAKQVTFRSNISENIGKITVDTYLMTSNGTVGSENETWMVRSGDLKWNIAFEDWTWCGCKKGGKEETGVFIDLDVTVSGNGDAQKKGGSNKTIDLGENMSLGLSNMILVDGTWKSMPTGYPKISTSGKATTVTFRFPKFTKKALYDPVISNTADTSGENDGNNNVLNSAMAASGMQALAFSLLAVGAQLLA